MLSRETILPAYIQNPPPLFSCFQRISPATTVVSRCGARAPFGRIVAPEYSPLVLSATIRTITMGMSLPPAGPFLKVNVPSHTPAYGCCALRGIPFGASPRGAPLAPSGALRRICACPVPTPTAISTLARQLIPSRLTRTSGLSSARNANAATPIDICAPAIGTVGMGRVHGYSGRVEGIHFSTRLVASGHVSEEERSENPSDPEASEHVLRRRCPP